MTRAEELKAWLVQRDVEYYENDDPTVTDAEYDKACREYLSETGTKHIALGKPAAGTKRVQHNPPMLSLDKQTEVNGLVKWLPAKGTYVGQPKVDGLSGAIQYYSGKAHQAATRGDGSEGEDVSYLLEELVHGIGPMGLGVQTLNIPRDVSLNPVQFEVRGEFYIPTALWEQHFKPRGAKNPRNSAAGLVRKQSWDPLKAHLRFVAYSLHDPVTGEPINADYFEDLTALDTMGFEITPGWVLTDEDFKSLTPESIHPSAWHGKPLHYDIDGVVFKHVDFDVRAELGSTDKFPRWAVAWKFLTEEQYSTIVAIDWVVGMTGVVVPTYIFTPIQLCQTTVTRATGHNFKYFQEIGAGIGDRVLVRKAGEIIPQVVRKA